MVFWPAHSASLHTVGTECPGHGKCFKPPSLSTAVVGLYLASLYATDPGTGQGKAQATQGRVGQSSPPQTDETGVPPTRDSGVLARITRSFAGRRAPQSELAPLQAPSTHARRWLAQRQSLVRP